MGQHSGIGVLDKAVAVLQAVAEDPCGLAELCTRTGLPRATAHRLAVGLEVHRLLRRGPDGRWRPGTALAELAGGSTDPLLDAAGSVLPKLRLTTPFVIIPPPTKMGLHSAQFTIELNKPIALALRDPRRQPHRRCRCRD